MDPTVLPAAAVILSALFVLMGGVYTARSVGRAQARTAATEEQKVDLQRVESMRQDIADLRRERTEDKAAHHAEIDTLRREHGVEIQALRRRVEQLEHEREEDRAELHALTEYARLLLGLLRDAGIAYPPPPPRLS